LLSRTAPSWLLIYCSYKLSKFESSLFDFLFKISFCHIFYVFEAFALIFIK
jgi:hypothetical protein